MMYEQVFEMEILASTMEQ